MSNHQSTGQASGGQSGGTATSAPSLPNLNAQTYPFPVVQHMIDEAAIINTYTLPESDRSGRDAGGRTSSEARGMELSQTLHRFNVDLELPDAEFGVRVSNIVGEPIGKLKHRWQVIPDDFVASPGVEPAGAQLEPSRSQRFVMHDGSFTFGEGSDGFRGFGTGRTYPVSGGGSQQLMVAAVGEVIDGYGKFKGLEGSYVLTGEITGNGFQGNVQCRLIDPQRQIRTSSVSASIKPSTQSGTGLTYIQVRGQKRDENVETSYLFGPDGLPRGFKLWQQLRKVNLDSATGGRRGLRSSERVDQVVGRMTSQVFLNILNPGAPGTSLAPIPFSSYNEFFFVDHKGNSVGSFVAEGGEGRTFGVKLKSAPGQQALRFGAFQTMTNGTGCFKGVQGLMTDNSIVGVAPHATSTLYVMCISDPVGRFLAHLGGSRH
jgi:hypothetical protein